MEQAGKAPPWGNGHITERDSQSVNVCVNMYLVCERRAFPHACVYSLCVYSLIIRRGTGEVGHTERRPYFSLIIGVPSGEWATYIINRLWSGLTQVSKHRRQWTDYNEEMAAPPQLAAVTVFLPPQLHMWKNQNKQTSRPQQLSRLLLVCQKVIFYSDLTELYLHTAGLGPGLNSWLTSVFQEGGTHRVMASLSDSTGKMKKGWGGARVSNFHHGLDSPESSRWTH